MEGYWPGAPDLVVEVVSPGDGYTEVEEKVFDWLEAGAGMVVVINPRTRALTLYGAQGDIAILKEGEVLDGGQIVPGWQVPVVDLFV